MRKAMNKVKSKVMRKAMNKVKNKVMSKAMNKVKYKVMNSVTGRININLIRVCAGVLAVIMTATAFTACEKKVEKINKDEVKITATPAGDDVTPPTDDVNQNKESNVPQGDKPTPTIIIDPNNPIPTEQGTENATTPEKDKEIEEETDDGRGEKWKQSYLIWLPKFTGGKLDNTYAEDTFDYAVFTSVSEKDMEAYIELLTEKGFEEGVELSEKNGIMYYTAGNQKNWTVILKYEEQILTIGSGFYDEEDKDVNEELDKLKATTAFGYLPDFNEGKYERYNVNQDGTIIVCYSNVSSAYARDYISVLSENGFIYEVDEGDSDGTVWYMAISEDRLQCDFIYYDGYVQLGCREYRND